jgi:hypothetical protein
MTPRIKFILIMLGLLFVANILMLSGFTNYNRVDVEGFADFVLSGAATGTTYKPIGTYDGLIKVPDHGLSKWRGPAPNEPLSGPDGVPGPDRLFMFKNNQCKPECCPASFSCGSGCVCTTDAQRELINTRGGNRTNPVDL